ncbi:MAG: hypothetical protein LUH10_09370 [Tannerellaceae bacterium]|nr:hypothetical protein [Tannerellaceae bacterium]
MFCPFITKAAEWQWSVSIDSHISSETGETSTAFLWIPSGCKDLKAVVVGCHNMLEEPIFEHPGFRTEMEKLDVGLIWITPGIDPLFDPVKGSQAAFDEMFRKLSVVSGYNELENIPVVPIGHSAYASYPWNYAAFNPARTLAILSIKGDAPRTHLTGCGRPNVEWEGRSIQGIPGLMVMGEYEWWTDRLITAFDYRRQYPDAPVSVLCDAGRGHFDISDNLVSYLALFIRKSIDTRLSATDELIPVDAKNGWLMPCWQPDSITKYDSAPYTFYPGNAADAFWYFDEEMIQATRNIYMLAQGKTGQYIGFEQNGRLLSYNSIQHSRIQAVFDPGQDGVTFHLSATFTDSLREKRVQSHARTPLSINRICGPVEKVNDTTFTVRFYRMGLTNQKRTGDIWLLAENPGDETYKSTVQQLNLKIPLANPTGEPQQIHFPALPDVTGDCTQLPLQAVASSGLPVYYYVKEGPAKIKDNMLQLTPVPPKTKYPVKVTVVAWQYGRSIAPEIQTATPVERTFYITQ